MPNVAWELPSGRPSSMDNDGEVSASAPWVVCLAASDDELTARNYLLTVAASTYDGAAIKAVRVQERIKSGVFKCEVTYENEIKVNSWTFGFDGTAISTKTTVAKSIRAFTKDGGRGAPLVVDASMPIGLEGVGTEMRAKGVDVLVANFKFQLSLKLSNSSYSMAYALSIAGLAGKFNNAAFPPTGTGWKDAQFPEGTLQFIGPTGDRNEDSTGDVNSSLSFSFIHFPDDDTGEIAGIEYEKKGTEVLWTGTQFNDQFEVPDPANPGNKKKVAIDEVVTVFCGEVGEKADFGAFGLT